jgi:hypothetical protein
MLPSPMSVTRVTDALGIGYSSDVNRWRHPCHCLAWICNPRQISSLLIVRRHQPMLQRVGSRLRAVFQLQFAQDAFQMALDGVHRDQ